MFGIVALHLTYSVEATPSREYFGVFVNTIGVESSMGFQRYHHGIGGFWQRCQQSENTDWTVHQPMLTCWHHSIRTGGDVQTIPSLGTGPLDTHMLTGTVTLDTLKGVTFAEKTVKIGFFAGTGLDVYLGGAEVLVATVKPSVVTEIQVQVPIQNHLLWFNGGHRIWIHRANPMLSCGWGTQW